MSALALLYLRRVPGIAWVILFVVALLGASAYGIYRHGESAGEATVHRVALKDSTRTQITTVAQATRAADIVGVVAAKAVRISTTGRTRARAVLEAATDSVPPSVVAEIAAQFDRDSATIAVLVAKSDSDHTERLARIQLDTLREHAEPVTPPSDGVSATEVLADVGIVAVVIEVIRLALQLLHR
jgi:hypothetical protein